MLKKRVAPYSAATLSQTFELLFKEEASLRFATQPKLALEMIFFRILQLKPNLAIDELIAKLDDLKSGRPCPAADQIPDQTPWPQKAEPTQAAGDPPGHRRQGPGCLGQTEVQLAICSFRLFSDEFYSLLENFS